MRPKSSVVSLFSVKIKMAESRWLAQRIIRLWAYKECVLPCVISEA